VLAPVVVTFGLSVMIENLLQVPATCDPRGLNGGALTLASFHISSGITVSWLFLSGFLTACAVLSCLQLLLLRPRGAARSGPPPTTSTPPGWSASGAAGVRDHGGYRGSHGRPRRGVHRTIGTFDPQAGPNTLAGGVALGVTQVVVGEVNQAYAVLAVHLLFLAVLTVRPGRAWSSWPAWRWCPSSSASAPTLFIWSPRTG
jgi:branched-chain amino acid transport system permease protein